MWLTLFPPDAIFSTSAKFIHSAYDCNEMQHSISAMDTVDRESNTLTNTVKFSFGGKYIFVLDDWAENEPLK